MTELLKIINAIQQQSHDRVPGNLIEDFLQKARSLGLPTYAACKILESHLVSESRANIKSGTEGWISVGDEIKHSSETSSSIRKIVSESEIKQDNKIITEDLLKPGKVESSAISEDRRNYRPLLYLAIISLLIATFVFALTKDPVRYYILHSFPAIGGYIYNEHPPDIPLLISPSDGASGLPTLIKLIWDCTDPDRDHLKYDVYLGLSGSSLKLESANWSSKTFVMDGLNYGVGYSWQIIAKDINGLTTAGERWTFKTKPELDGFANTTLNNSDRNSTVTDRQKYVSLYVVPYSEGEIKDSSLNIRTGPGTDYPLIDKLEAGEVIELLQDGLGIEESWCKIYCPTKKITGYVYKKYLQKI